jgi:hypothetical protein
MLGIYRVPAQVVASRVVLSSTELVNTIQQYLLHFESPCATYYYATY